PGNPNAHFTFRRPACAPVSPAVLPSWKRVLLVLSPQPFQFFPAAGLNAPGTICAVTHIADCAGAVERSRPDSVLPVTNCAIARRSAPVLRLAIEIIGPVSMAASTRSAVIDCSASRDGAR